MKEKISPDFIDLGNPEVYKEHINDLTKPEESLSQNEILCELLEQIRPVDFAELVSVRIKQLKEELEKCDPNSKTAEEIRAEIDDIKTEKVKEKHLVVISVEEVLRIAKEKRWGLSKNNDFVYLYNGKYWILLNKETLQKFLGEAAEKMGVDWVSARHFRFREQLLKQFLTAAYLPTPDFDKEKVSINLQNGTFDITSDGKWDIRRFDPADFITYQLPFEFDELAEAPIFQKYLDRCVPDKSIQMVLAEYLGYVFVRNGSDALKEEKVLVLYGSGANGKSVLFEVINALLGSENVSNYSLQTLTDEKGYQRAMIANKLLNYASELTGKHNPAMFKQLASGEPVEARLPYGQPFMMPQYAKLIFNANELPRDGERNEAYHRRFLIAPFSVTIPPEERDKRLHRKIIENELPGVFNWILEGLKRLLNNKGFSESESMDQANENFRKESDSVMLFMDEFGYEKDLEHSTPMSDLYRTYGLFCQEFGMSAVNRTNFNKRLTAMGITIRRVTNGVQGVFLKKQKE